MTPTDTGTGVQPCLTAISSTFSGLFDTLDTWRATIAGTRWPVPGPTAAAVDELTESLVSQHLSAPHATVVGAGFVARPGWITDAVWHLAWWLGAANTLGLTGGDLGSVRRLTTNVDPTSESFRDYTGLEWWRIPARTGRPHITGPYVDYLCTDAYTLTLTAPVLIQQIGTSFVGAGDELVGMVGVDIYVDTIEALLLRHLRRLGGTATLLNAAGRVVVSTDPHRAAGLILRRDGLHDHLAAGRDAVLPAGDELHHCPGTTLSLLLEPQPDQH